MSIWIEDSARNALASRAKDGRSKGLTTDAVLSPFCTPREFDWKQGGKQTVDRLIDADVQPWFDPHTHALQMPNVGYYHYYSSWDLWPGSIGELGSEAAMRAHVERVFKVQDELGVPHLAPTLLLHTAQSNTSQQALDLSRLAVSIDPECRLTIAGDQTFWSGGPLLDGHIGALSQLEPGGWFVSAVRQLAVVPVPSAPDEVFGMCRTVRALSEESPVHISHGDLAGLPAYAAGGASLGTGWDSRQKVSAYSNYEARDPESDGGQWFSQATVEKLLSCLVKSDANVLADRNSAFSRQIMPGAVPPGPKEAWLHHAVVMERITSSLDLDYEAAYLMLVHLYEEARQHWPKVADTIGISSQHEAWIDPLLAGLQKYGAVEGF